MTGGINGPALAAFAPILLVTMLGMDFSPIPGSARPSSTG